jgi:beta-glucosidase
MKHDKTRRDFLRELTLAASSVALSRRETRAAAESHTTPFPVPTFYWGVGIENCWIAQVNPVLDGQRRLLDVFLQMDHYDRWQEDLDLAAATGVNAIRYSVPWYKAEPKPGIYDWSWIDKPIEYLVRKLKIIPIMDIIHYGTPAWMANGVLDDRFPEAIGNYAGAMAAHFKGLVNHYSPANEPGLTCLFSGLIGRWPPYHKSVESWARVGVQMAKGMVLETQAIRQVISDAVIVSVDPWFSEVADGFLPKDSGDELRKAAAAYPASLAYGKVRTGHPFGAFLVQQGIRREDLAWFDTHATRPDILGFNYYPDIHAFSKEGDFTRHGRLPLEQAAKEAADLAKQGICQAQAYFNLPVYLTETSAGLSAPAKVAYINALFAMTQELRREGVPFVGINWWPLFNTIQWDYREKFNQPLKDFICPGGWNNGLCVIDTLPDGTLNRVWTPAADSYKTVIKRDLTR